MTLQELLTAALQQLDRSTDAQTLETWRDKLTRYLNDAIVDLAGELRPRRTETAQISGRTLDLTLLERPCIKVLALRRTGGGCRFTTARARPRCTCRAGRTGRPKLPINICRSCSRPIPTCRSCPSGATARS